MVVTRSWPLDRTAIFSTHVSLGKRQTSRTLVEGIAEAVAQLQYAGTVVRTWVTAVHTAQKLRIA